MRGKDAALTLTDPEDVCWYSPASIRYHGGGALTRDPKTTTREITIISGKGGTGKTTLTAAFSSLASQKAVLADCDVDAADLHLILRPEVLEREDFYGLKVAEIDQDKCIHCGRCSEACRFGAITQDILVIRERCEGCGVCKLVCPADAVLLVDRVDGELYVSRTRFGPMAHARLRAGGEGSGKLVAEVRKKASWLASQYRLPYIISDGPPGIGCPVISAITGTSLAVVVTEPTVSGISDLMRVLETTRHFNVPAGVVINKADINRKKSREIQQFCKAHDIPVFGELPYDIVATESMVAEQTVIEYSDGPFSDKIREIWDVILGE